MNVDFYASPESLCVVFKNKLGILALMLSSLKKKILGTPSTPKATLVPVVATAVASPVSLLARETSGRNIRKIVDTNTVYNQFEQLKKFQHINSPSDIIYQEKSDKSYITPEKAQKKSHVNGNAKLPVGLLLVALVSAVTASVVVLLYTHLYVMTSVSAPSNGLVSQHHAPIAYESFQNPYPVQQYLPQPYATVTESTPSASIYKIIRIRERSSAGQDGEEVKLESAEVKGRMKRKYLTRSSLKKIWGVVSSIVMVPVELKDENDFHFY